MSNVLSQFQASWFNNVRILIVSFYFLLYFCNQRGYLSLLEISYYHPLEFVIIPELLYFLGNSLILVAFKLQKWCFNRINSFCQQDVKSAICNLVWFFVVKIFIIFNKILESNLKQYFTFASLMNSMNLVTDVV